MRARPISCCFSGHRPAKLPWGEDEDDPRCRALKARLAAALSYSGYAMTRRVYEKTQWRGKK